MRYAGVVFTLFLGGCAAGGSIQTGSAERAWLPERTFKGQTVDGLKEKLANVCAQLGAERDPRPSPGIICVQKMSDADWLTASVTIETGMATAPLQFTEFMFEQKGPDVRAAIRQYGKTRPPIGFSKEFELDRPADAERAQNFLNRLSI